MADKASINTLDCSLVPIVIRKYGATRLGDLKCRTIMLCSRSFAVNAAPSCALCLAKIKFAPEGNTSKPNSDIAHNLEVHVDGNPQ